MLSKARSRVFAVLSVIALSALACSVCTFGGSGLAPELGEQGQGSSSGQQEIAPVPEIITNPAPASAYDTLGALNEAVLPPRDRLDLAGRLLGLSPEEIAPPTPKTYSIGDREIFWADNNETDEVFQVTAVLRYATPHVYMWIEQGVNYDQGDLAEAADLFEEQVYPTNHQYFGTEWSPGIDSDEHLHILHVTGIGSGIAGYYSSQSQYPSAAVPYSNEREMFFINIGNTRPGDGFYDGVLAHEFQHMIHWNVDRNEDSWVNEGLSELAVLLNGFEVTGAEFYFVSNPDIRLTDWPDVDSGRRAYYGAAFLFHAYYLDRFGDDALRALVRNPQNGLEAIEGTLASEGIIDPATGQPITAVDFFADWTIANYANDPSLADGRYTYTLLPNFEEASAVQIVARLPFEDSATVNQFGTDYIELPVEDRLHISFEGSQQVQLMDTSTVNTDGDPATADRFVWWSNRGDDSDMTLTVPLDLTGVGTATLEYDVWYLIEGNWDYAYLMVSEDGGATWVPLETAYTSLENPHGTSYGPGYTGVSADMPGANGEGWLHESIDLSAYAGREILIRYEMITDDAVNQPGLLIDNVRVDAIGFYDDAEGGSGVWEAQGFVRHDNVLPQQYVVQVLSLGDAPQLERMTLDASNRGEMVFEPGPGTDQVVLVVSGVTPHTGELASYAFVVGEASP